MEPGTGLSVDECQDWVENLVAKDGLETGAFEVECLQLCSDSGAPHADTVEEEQTSRTEQVADDVVLAGGQNVKEQVASLVEDEKYHNLLAGLEELVVGWVEAV